MTYEVDVPMKFKQGAAMFFSKARNLTCWPIGAPRTMVVDGQTITTPAAPAFFDNHRWGTNLKEYAAGMVKNNLFGDEDGWHIDPACLPEEVLAVWPRLSVGAKRAFCLNLINGVDAGEALKVLPPQPAAPVFDPEPERPAQAMKCPVPECGLEVSGDLDQVAARASLLTHQKLMHPGWGA